MYFQPNDVSHLWETHLPATSEDFTHQTTLQGNLMDHTHPLIIAKVLLDIESHLFHNVKSLSHYPGLPIPDRSILDLERERARLQLLDEESNDNQQDLQTILDTANRMNQEQLAIYNKVINA